MKKLIGVKTNEFGVLVGIPEVKDRLSGNLSFSDKAKFFLSLMGFDVKESSERKPSHESSEWNPPQFQDAKSVLDILSKDNSHDEFSRDDQFFALWMTFLYCQKNNVDSPIKEFFQRLMIGVLFVEINQAVNQLEKGLAHSEKSESISNQFKLKFKSLFCEGKLPENPDKILGVGAYSTVIGVENSNEVFKIVPLTEQACHVLTKTEQMQKLTNGNYEPTNFNLDPMILFLNHSFLTGQTLYIARETLFFKAPRFDEKLSPLEKKIITCNLSDEIFLGGCDFKSSNIALTQKVLSEELDALDYDVHWSDAKVVLAHPVIETSVRAIIPEFVLGGTFHLPKSLSAKLYKDEIGKARVQWAQMMNLIHLRFVLSKEETTDWVNILTQRSDSGENENNKLVPILKRLLKDLKINTEESSDIFEFVLVNHEVVKSRLSCLLLKFIDDRVLPPAMLKRFNEAGDEMSGRRVSFATNPQIKEFDPDSSILTKGILGALGSARVPVLAASAGAREEDQGSKFSE